MKLSICIVAYHSELATLRHTIDSAVTAVEHARQQWPELLASLYLVDNDPAASTSRAIAEELRQLRQRGIHRVECLVPGSNLGYGGGHNLCRDQLDSDYHLVLNPDVILAPDALVQGLALLQREPGIVAVSPHGSDEHGAPLYLCKQYPTVFDLWLRGFVPSFLQQPFAKRLARYQMQDVYDGRQVVRGIPIISGCCMLLRTAAFRALRGFDERFFLYFEDFDLSLRLAAFGTLAYHPDMHVQHFGGFSARKGLWHIRQFAHSGKQFFDKHGWRWV